MSDTLNIEVNPRPETGKNANRRSRAAGKIPAVVYGGGRESVAIEVDRKTLLDTMKGHSGETRCPGGSERRLQQKQHVLFVFVIVLTFQ